MTRAGILETLVGVVVIAIAALFLFYAYGASGKNLGRDAYMLSAVFGRVDGVTAGSEVRIAGVKVGTVAGHELDQQTYEAVLQLAMSDAVRVPEDSVAKIVSDGVLGGAHVAIEPGASEVMLEAGDKITITQGSVDLLGLAVQAFTSQAGNGGDGSAEENTGQTELDPLGDL